MWNCGKSQCASENNSYTYNRSPAAMCTRHLPIFQCQNVDEELVSSPGTGGAGESEAFVPIFRKHSWEKNTGDVKFWSILRGTESSEREIIKRYNAGNCLEPKLCDMTEESPKTDETVPIGFHKIDPPVQVSRDGVPETDIGDSSFHHHEPPTKDTDKISADDYKIRSSHTNVNKVIPSRLSEGLYMGKDPEESNQQSRIQTHSLPNEISQRKFNSVLPHLNCHTTYGSVDSMPYSMSINHKRTGQCPPSLPCPTDNLPLEQIIEERHVCRPPQHLIPSSSQISKREGHPRMSSSCLHPHIQETIDRTTPTFQCYRIDKNLPLRFQYPAMIKGYNARPDNCRWLTTNADYGMTPPTIHHVPVTYHRRSWNFWEDLLHHGMYRDNQFTTRLSKDDLFCGR